MSQQAQFIDVPVTAEVVTEVGSAKLNKSEGLIIDGEEYTLKEFTVKVTKYSVGSRSGESKSPGFKTDKDKVILFTMFANIARYPKKDVQGNRITFEGTFNKDFKELWDKQPEGTTNEEFAKAVLTMIGKRKLVSKHVPFRTLMRDGGEGWLEYIRTDYVVE